MNKLVECLELFNRKERYWLLQDCLSEQNNLCLSESLCGRLKEKIKVDVPVDAWWAMDYHLDWLHLAMRQFVMDGDIPEIEITERKNIEDIDFVVAFENILILIEAKVDESWSNRQLSSKLPRLDKLKSILSIKAIDQTIKSYNDTKLYFLLTSPNPPMKINDKNRQDIAIFNGFGQHEDDSWFKLQSTSKLQRK